MTRDLAILSLSILLVSACSAQDGGVGTANHVATPSGFAFSHVEMPEGLDPKVRDFLEICGPIMDAQKSVVPMDVGLGWEASESAVPPAGKSQVFEKTFDDLDYVLGVSERAISDDQSIFMCSLSAKVMADIRPKDLVDIKVFKKLDMDKGKIHKIEGGLMGEWSSGEFPSVVTVGAESRSTEYKGSPLASLSFYVQKIQSNSEE